MASFELTWTDGSAPPSVLSHHTDPVLFIVTMTTFRIVRVGALQEERLVEIQFSIITYV